MQNNLQPNYHQQQPPARRPSPYEQRRHSYNHQQRPRPLPPPTGQPPTTDSDPYQAAYSQLQGHRPTGSYYPEAHMSAPRPSPSVSPEIVSPRPQRLTPSMPANLAQNLDQQGYNQPSTRKSYDGSQAPQLPALDLQRRPSEMSVYSEYSQTSALDEYLNSDLLKYPPQPQTTQASKSDSYSTYAPQRQNPQAMQPPQAPFKTPARPNSAQDRIQQLQYPAPPPVQDYSSRPLSSSGGRPIYQNQQFQNQQNRMSTGSQDQYSFPPQTGRQPLNRPYSQDMSNRISGYYPETAAIPIPSLEDLSLNDPYAPQPRPMEPPNKSPRHSQSFGTNAVTPNASPKAIPSEYEWENEIDSQRDNALRTTDPNIALSWAEKVYMYVSISLEEIRRDQEIHVSEPRPSTPDYERELRKDCITIVEKFAKMGHPKAIYMRGIWFEYGDFKYPNDRGEAYHAYQASAKAGYARAEYRLGKMYEDVGDMKRGINHYEKGVSLGDSAALYRMGMLRLLGQKGYPVNYPEAVKFLHQSAGTADLDAPQGAYVLALLLAGEFNGVTIPQNILPRDERLARRMLEKASSLGFSHAQQKLGAAYENGTGSCGYDPAMSLYYYSLAAKQGDPEASMGLSKWYLCGADGFPANEEKAYIYAERAAKKGLPQAEFAMGYFYEVGICVAVDITMAEGWYQKAAEHGNKDALQRREGISRSQTLSRKDHDTITNKIRSGRLKKGQKAPIIPSTPPLPPMPEQYAPQPSYADPNQRSQSPGRNPRYSTGPQPVHGRTSSGGGPQPQLSERPTNSRHSSYAGYTSPEYPADLRKSSYTGVTPNEPSLASLVNTSDAGYSYVPPVRPQPGSRPTSQGSSIVGGPPPTALSRPTTNSDPHGLGPKTFQEMGVKTQHKKDSDCVVM